MMARIVFSYLLCVTVYSINMLEYYQVGQNNKPRGIDDEMYYIKPK